jgi:hypothetical protein
MRSKQEIRNIVDGFAKSGMRRREYCEKNNIGMSTLDYWRRTQKSKPRLVEVTVATGDGIRARAGQRTAHRRLVEVRRG